VLGSLRSHGALAKIRYALALNGTVRVCNKNSTFLLTHAQLSLTLMPLLGLSWIIGDSQKRGFARLDVLGSLRSHGALAKIRKRKRLFCKSRWKINRKKEKGKGKFV